MKELIQIFLAMSILEPERALKAASDFRSVLPASKWQKAIEAEKKRLRQPLNLP